MKHPSDMTLSMFVDRELPLGEAARVRDHIAVCDRCGAVVADFHALQDAAREVREMSVPPGLADEVLARRRAGERIVLTPSDPEDRIREQRRSRSPWRVAAAAAAVVLAAVVGLTVLAPPVEAVRGELWVLPETPRPGSTAEFRYRPGILLAGSDSLRLRVQTRKAGDPSPRDGVIGELQSAVLRPRADGTLGASVPVPMGAVYMAAAVESMDGELIDTNSGALWDLFVASEDGRISTAAIEAKYRVLAQRNFILATDWAAETTADYPSLAIGWALMLIHEQDATSGDLPSDRRVFHEERLADLMVGRATSSDPDQLRWLALYARRLEADTAYATIVNHLREVDPTNQEVQLHDVAQTLRTVPPERWLATADSVWEAHGRGSQAVVNLGFAAARASDDPAAFRRWMDRNAQAGAEPLAIVAEKVPKTARFAAVELMIRQAIVDSLRKMEPEERSLYDTESEHAARTAAALDEAQLELAWVELAAGDSATALALLRASEGALTDPGQLGRYADLLLARGDTALAALAAARIAADPLGSGEVPEQYDALPQMVGSERAVLLERGRVELERALLAHAPVPRPMHGNPTVVLREGGSVPLRRLLGPRPTVLVFWSTQSPSSVQFAATASHLGHRTGVPTVHAIIRTEVVTETASPAPQLHDDPVIEDGTEVAVAVRNSVLPQAVLLDGSLRVVASSADLNRIYRIAKLLR